MKQLNHFLLKGFDNASSQISKCEVKMIKKGCFEDIHAHNRNRDSRPLNKLLHINYHIAWGSGWHKYLHDTVCQ